MNTEVIYVSGTGNTAAVAKEIFQALPSSPKDIQELDRARNTLSADCYFIGFWANRGTASVEVLDFLSELHGKRWLFSAPAAWEIPGILRGAGKQGPAFLPDDNEYFGSFFCQGKMPIRVREKYEAMLGTEHDQLASRLIKNFDEALFHPSAEDFEKPLLLPKTSVKNGGRSMKDKFQRFMAGRYGVDELGKYSHISRSPFSSSDFSSGAVS